MRIYIIRHGESVDDVEDCYGGIADFALTERGREQAHQVGKRLSTVGIKAIFSSPLRRAFESAEIISKELAIPVPVNVIDQLQERNTYGVLSGVNKQKAEEIFAHILKELKEKPGYSRDTIVGAEEYLLFSERVRQAFGRVIKDAQKAGWECIAIVTHGKFTRALFDDVVDVGQEIDLKLSAVNVIEYSPAKAQLHNMS